MYIQVSVLALIELPFMVCYIPFVLMDDDLKSLSSSSIASLIKSPTKSEEDSASWSLSFS